jgi:hypothetical protein
MRGHGANEGHGSSPGKGVGDPMKMVRFLFAVSVFALAEVSFAQVVVGPNVDIVANDPYNQKQVEVAAAVNPLNPSHVFAGYIDYQTVVNEDPTKSPTSRGVCGFSFSTNGGKTWRNGLVPALPDREKCGDPAVAWDTNRHVFYFGLVQRLDGIREMMVWRFTDPDDGTGTLRYDFMVQVDTGTPGAALDKNSLIFQPDATSPDPSAPGTLYACYASLQGNAQNNIKILCAISRDSGASWSPPSQGKYNGNVNSNNGTAAAPGPGGSIYLFWRAFSASENGVYMVKVSPDGNATSPAMVVGGAGFHPMDMPTRPDLARSNAFPAVASDGDQKILLTFQAYSDPFGYIAPPSVENTSRIFGTYTTDGGASWSEPRAIDYGPHANAVQFMPSAVHSGGVFSVVYYDGRNDGCVTQEGMAGSEFGEGTCGTGRPNNVVDAGLPTEGYFPTGNDRRFELRVAQGTFDASNNLIFTSSDQATQYDTQASSDPLPHPLVPRNANCGPDGCPGVNYQFLRVGGGGSVAWTGDYIAHVAKVPLLRNLPTAADPNPPAWRHSRPGDPTTVLAFWPDFSKVAFPLNALGDPDIYAAWTQFVPAGFTTCVNPKTRDVRMLFAEITNRGLLVSVKATSRRPVAGTTAIPPEFAVTVQNLTSETVFVSLTLTDSAPVDDWSLRQTLPDEVSVDLNQVDLKIMRNSSVTQMIYYRWRDSSEASPTAPAMVSVQQLTGRLLDENSDCLLPDPEDPPLVAPVCVPGGSLVPNGLTASAMYNVTSSSLPIGTPHGVLVSAPVVTSFSSASDQPSNSRIDNSRIDNSRIDNSRIDNSRIDNSRIDNSRIDNSRIDNSLVSDQQILWTVTGAGALTTAATAFSQVANGQTLLENGWAFQLLIYQTQLNPNVRGCELTSTATDVVLSNIVITEPNGTYSRIDNSRIDNFQVSASRIDNSRIDNSRIDNSRIDNAAVEDSPLSEQVSNATTALDTYEEATIVLRAFKPEGSHESLVVCQDPTETGQCPQSDQVAQAVFGQAANVDPVTGQTTFVQASFDATPPEITYELNPGPNANGWNNTDVTLTWSVIDPQSGVLSSVGCDDAVVTTEGTTEFTCSATNRSTTAGVDHDAFLTVTINIDKTPPTATAGRSPAGNAGGWNNTDVMVTFSGVDDLSGIDSCAPVVRLSSDGRDQSASGTCNDRAGNQSLPATVSGINIDKTPPAITLTSRTPANNGWNNTNVVLTWTCTDALSGPVAADVSQTVTTEGAGQSVTGTCMDVAGNTAGDTQTGINIDKTPPTITLASRTPANANGWNNTDVVVTWTCSDALSGPLAPELSQSVTTEGADQSATGTCTDLAGNTTSDTQTEINIDKTPPVVTITTPGDDASYLLNQSVASNYSCSDDGGSGIETETCIGPVSTGVNLNTGTPGSSDFTVDAADRAGNLATRTHTYWVVYGFALTPPKSPAKAGSAVPLTWQLTDANGAPISDLGSLVTLTSYYTGNGGGACTLDTPGAGARLYSPATGATGGSDFRFIQSSVSYRFNWASATQKGCYTLVWQLNDNSGPAPDYAVLNPSLLKKTSIRLK